MKNVEFIHRIKEERVKIPDVALLYACGQGELEALGLLFERYHTNVYRFLSRLLGSNQQDLDDLVQTTFIEIQKSAKSFKENSSVKTWIMGIATNVARHYFRSESRRKRVLQVCSEMPDGSTGDYFNVMEHNELMNRLAEAIQDLPYNHRVVFVLCDLEGVPGVEAARLLGVRQGTVWRRLHEVRKTLRAAVERGKR